MKSFALVLALCLVAASFAVRADIPAELTVEVDCTKGTKDAIAKALKRKAVELTIEISGICEEDVSILRSRVTLRGNDPATDGIRPAPDGPKRQALTLRNTSLVNIENLKLTGAFSGIGINDSFGVYLLNCRLEDNTFSGAIVGTASGSVFFTDTVVSTSLVGEISARGIWATNGSNATCDNCTIQDYGTALQVSTGSQLTVNGGSINGTQYALRVFYNSSSFVSGATLDGRIRMFDKSSTTLIGVNQINAPGSNQLRTGSLLSARGGTSLVGPTFVSEFTDIALFDTSSVSGNLTCSSGGDAFCDNPLTATASSNCGQCTNPPPP